MKKIVMILFAVLLICNWFTACVQIVDKQVPSIAPEITIAPEIIKDSSNNKQEAVFEPMQLTPIDTIEQSVINCGLVDIKVIDSSIAVDLRYSTSNNFLGIDVYGEFNKCYLQPDIAEKLKRSQTFLKKQFPYYSLIVYDAVRPRSIQCRMWDTINVPHTERSKYLSNPKSGSLHNFGAAVDLAIIDENGIELDMGTCYDYFGELAYPREEERMAKEGKLTRYQLFNRELLRNVMKQGGFSPITTEWWHFNSCSRNEAIVKYKIIE
jgi:D-alanyl-D-alanine dipeptidase